MNTFTLFNKKRKAKPKQMKSTSASPAGEKAARAGPVREKAAAASLSGDKDESNQSD